PRARAGLTDPGGNAPGARRRRGREIHGPIRWAAASDRCGGGASASGTLSRGTVGRMASDLRVEATAGWVAADGMETAARLLVEQGVAEHSVGSLTILAAARRRGLGPADAVALALEVSS